MENLTNLIEKKTLPSKQELTLYINPRPKRDLSLLSPISRSSNDSSEEYPELQEIARSHLVRSRASMAESKKSYKDHSLSDVVSVCRSKASTAGVTSEMENDSEEDTPDFIDDAEDLLEDICDVTVDAGRIIKREVLEGFEELTKPEEVDEEYSWVDGLWGLFSAATFMFDLASDVFLSSAMEEDPEAKYYSMTTLLLAVIPLIVQNLFSIYWYWFDDRKTVRNRKLHRKTRPTVWCLRLFCHTILLAPVLRQLDVIYYGIKSAKGAKINKKNSLTKKENDDKNNKKEPANETLLLGRSTSDSASISKRNIYRDLWLHAESDSAALDLLGTLLQDAPQMVFQLYIMTKTMPSLKSESEITTTMMAQLASVSISLVTMAWTVTAFVRAVRLPAPELRALSPIEIVLLTLVHFAAITPQVGCFALLASKQIVICLSVAAIHWIIATISICLQFLWLPVTAVREAIFVHDLRRGSFAWLDDVAFSAALGVAFLFTFVDVDGAAPIIQAVAFCIFRLIEQTIFITIWYFSSLKSSWWYWLPYVLSSVSFIISLLLSILFYSLVNRGIKSKDISFRRSRTSLSML